MPHYRDTENKVHWLDSIEFEYLLPSGSVQITNEEASALNPHPEPLIPSVVSMRQARLALMEYGLLDQVKAAVASGSQADQITWEYATEVRRDDSLVAVLSAGMGLTDMQLDALFILASTL